MMQRVSRSAPTVCTTTAVLAAVRCHVSAKGDTLYRLDKWMIEKDQKKALDGYWAGVNERKPKTFANRKEELAHLAARPDYEYVGDFQRAAHDMMAVQSDPHKWVTDMAYHYHRVWKVASASKTNHMDGNGCIEHCRVVPQ